jgi:hypothetical protein
MNDVTLAWIGTVASVLGAVISLLQAKAARSARDEVALVADQLKAVECARWLEHALRSASPLLNTGTKARGLDPHEVLERVQNEFDQAFLAAPSERNLPGIPEKMSTISLVLAKTRAGVSTGNYSGEELCDALRDAAQYAKNAVRPSAL